MCVFTVVCGEQVCLGGHVCGVCMSVWCTHECAVSGYGCGVRGMYGVCECVSVPACAGVPLCLGVVSAHVYEHICEDCSCLFCVLSRE